MIHSCACLKTDTYLFSLSLSLLVQALGRSRGTPSAFATHEAVLKGCPPKILAYVRMAAAGEKQGASSHYDIRARMHRANGTEDAGTGGANVALVGLLGSLQQGETAMTVSASILQGVEMGRPSELQGDAEVLPLQSRVGGVRIGGQCAAVSRGEWIL